MEDGSYTPARQWLTREELVLFEPSRAHEPSDFSDALRCIYTNTPATNLRIYMYTHTCAPTNLGTWTLLGVYTCICMYAQTIARIHQHYGYVCWGMCVCVWVCIYVDVRTHTRSHVCICINVYIHITTRAHTCAYIYCVCACMCV